MNNQVTSYADEQPLDTLRAVVPEAEPRRWTVPNASPAGGDLEIAGWDFGGRGPGRARRFSRLRGAPWPRL